MGLAPVSMRGRDCDAELGFKQNEWQEQSRAPSTPGDLGSPPWVLVMFTKLRQLHQLHQASTHHPEPSRVLMRFLPTYLFFFFFFLFPSKLRNQIRLVPDIAS